MNIYELLEGVDILGITLGGAFLVSGIFSFLSDLYFYLKNNWDFNQINPLTKFIYRTRKEDPSFHGSESFIYDLFIALVGLVWLLIVI